MSLLRTGYDLPLWLPVTGLVYVVVSDAPRHVAVSGVQHAKVAPIMRASRIVISDDTNNRKRTIRLAYNVSAILHDKVASHSHKGGGFLRVLWNQSALPEGDPGIDKHGQQRKALQPHSCGFTSPIFLALGFVCGFVLFALGAVSLLYLWRTVNLNGTANRNLVFGLSLPISAALISLGQWILFSVT